MRAIPLPLARWSRTAAILLLVTAAAPLAADDKANQIADQLMQALGGKQAWDATHFLTFRFAGFRNHHWDKWTGRHRLEFINRVGEHWIVLQNLNTRQGRAFKNGVELSGEEAHKAVEAAYGTWINDTYWLLAPYKLRDRGVNLEYAGSETIDGVAYDKLHLSFDNVGLTPGDQYWVYVNPETHLVDRWAYRLQGTPADKEPTAWLWQGWQRYGNIMLAGGRRSPQGDRELPLDMIAVSETMADSIFNDPTPLVEAASEAPKP